MISIQSKLETGFKTGLTMARLSETRKNGQKSIKVVQNDFTRKMIEFDTFTKIV